MKKAIDVQNQPRLGFKRTLQFTLHGIHFRLFRSIVTIVVITVAIAFLMNILSESLIKASVVDRTAERIEELRLASVWVTRLSGTPTLEQILFEAAESEPGSAAWEQKRRFGQFTEEEMQTFSEEARTTAVYRRFFDELDFGEKRLLVGNAAGVEILDKAARGGPFLAQMEQRLTEMRQIQFPTEFEEFRQWLKQWPAIREKAVRLQTGHRAAVQQLRQTLGDVPVLTALAGATGPNGEKIRQAGFAFSPETAAQVELQAKRELDSRVIDESLLNPDLRRTVAARRDVLPSELTATDLWQMLKSSGDAEWFAGQLKEQGIQHEGLTPERIKELADVREEEQRLEQAQFAGADIGTGFLRLGERMRWLLIVSMMVCVFGIANAMLMAVAERFREIATLKCLGALDGFIMLMFVLEASMLGLAGGLAGSILGAIIGTGRMLASFGGLMLTGFPFGDLLFAILISLLFGVVLAALASIYPSLKAARLAPMEAMRIE